MNVAETLSAWTRFMANVLNRSDKTIRNYVGDVKNFLETEDKPLEDITSRDVQHYADIMAERGLAASSRSRKLSAIQSFFDWAVDAELLEFNPAARVRKPKIPQKEVKVMSPAEAKALIAAAKAMRDQENGERNLAIIVLMMSTGVRRDELTNIMLSDIDMEQKSILIREGKGDKQRFVYFNDDASQILHAYISKWRGKYRTTSSSDALFVTDRSGRISDSQVNRILAPLLEKAGLKGKFTVHSLRKVFATTVYNACEDIFAVQMLLGHANAQTTQRYVGVNENKKRAAAMAVNF